MNVTESSRSILSYITHVKCWPGSLTASSPMPRFSFRRQALAKETMSAGSLFDSSRTAVPVSNAGGATHYTEIDTEADRDARAILEKNVRLNE